MGNIIYSVSEEGHTIEIISPITPGPEGWFDFYRARTFEHESTQIHVPPVIRFGPIGVVNYLLNSLLTTFFTLYVSGDSYDGTIFYNFRLDTCLPAFATQSLCGIPAVIQYEDGHFVGGDRIFHQISHLLQSVFRSKARGGLCTNIHLADRLQTSNVKIVRGRPNVQLKEIEHLDNSTPTVMFSGRFDGLRGIDKYLSVVDGLSTEPVQFWVSGYGDDEDVEDVRRRCQALAEQGANVTFFGLLPWEEYTDRLVRADILVNFQDPDHRVSKFTFPTKLLDFMATKSIIVSTNMSDLESNFSDQMIIDGGSADELSQTLLGTLSELDAHRSKARAGREWVSANCDSETVAGQVVRVIQGC